MYVIDEINSSLISSIEYDEDKEDLTIHFRKYFVEELTYTGVSLKHFMLFVESKSVGKFYLQMIKPNFTLKNTQNMSDRPAGVNKASKDKRFIKMSINVDEINKEWIHIGEKGKYLQMTLMLLPDGEVDKFDNLGMIVQDVPVSVYKKDKTAKGSILGNGFEFARKAPEGTPGTDTGKLAENKDFDDLPF